MEIFGIQHIIVSSCPFDNDVQTYHYKKKLTDCAHELIYKLQLMSNEDSLKDISHSDSCMDIDQGQDPIT